jgi:hypothetical protein
VPLSPQYSVFVIASIAPLLERRFHRLADVTSDVAVYFVEKSPELGELTRLCDELIFAAENLETPDLPDTVCVAAVDVKQSCNSLCDLMFLFRKHFRVELPLSDSPTRLDRPHPLGSDLLNDLSDEISEEQYLAVLKTRKEIFCKLRNSLIELRAALTKNLSPFYELGTFFATAPDTVRDLSADERFTKVRSELTCRYQEAFSKCCDVLPALRRYMIESLDDEHIAECLDTYQRDLRTALKGLEVEVERGSEKKLPLPLIKVERHRYSNQAVPGSPEGWRELAKEGVELYGRKLNLPQAQTLLLLRLALARKALDIFELSEVEETWVEDLDSDSDERQEKRRNGIRSELSKLRRNLRDEFAELDGNPIITAQVSRSKSGESCKSTTTWKMDWDLLDKHGFPVRQVGTHLNQPSNK